MSKRVKQTLVISVVIGVIAIAAWLLYALVQNKGPSEVQIMQAYQQEIADMQSMSASLGVPILAMKVNKVTKQKCTVMDNQGHYRCQIVLDATIPMTGQTANQTTLVLKKEAKGWVIDRTIDLEDE